MRGFFLVGAIAMLLLATAFRLHDIDQQSLWHDEGNSLRLAERSVNDLMDAAGRDIHPPGYYMVLKGWISLVGTSELGLRSLSMFWSVITVAAVIGIGRRITGPSAALVAGLLIAIQPFAIYYAQETRMYAQLGALSMFSLWMLLHWLNAPQHHWRWAIGLAFINALGLYTHYTYPFTMLAQGVYVVWNWIEPRSRPRLFEFVTLNLLTLAMFAPWLPTAYDQVTTWPTTGDTTSVLDRTERIVTILIYGNTATELSTIAAVLPSFMLVMAFWALKEKSALVLPLLVCAFSIGALLLSGAYRETNLKFLLPAQAAIVVVLGAGLATFAVVRQPFTTVAAGILLIGLLLPFNRYIDRLYTDADYQRSDYRTISREIAALETGNSTVILNAPNQQEVFSYYFDGRSDVVGLPRGLGGDDLATRNETEILVSQSDRIFLVLWGQAERDPNAVVQSTLDASAYVVSRQWITDLELVQYAILDTPPPHPQVPLNVQFGDVLTLTGYALSADQFVAGRGDALGVTLYWEANTPIETRYKVSVQVLTPQGFLADQHDSEPANNLRPTTSFQTNEIVSDNHGLILNRDLPPGQYTLNVVVYDANNPEVRLQPNNNDPNAILTLTTLVIIADEE